MLLLSLFFIFCNKKTEQKPGILLETTNIYFGLSLQNYIHADISLRILLPCVMLMTFTTSRLAWSPRSFAAQCFLLCKSPRSTMNFLPQVNLLLSVPVSLDRFLAFWSSPHPISNSQLHTLLYFHLCPIYLVVFKGVYFFRMGHLILRGASRLDAFSVYPFQAWLPGRRLGSLTGTPAARPSRSSRTKDSSSQMSYAHAG